jgi:hypothetical protein
MILYKKTIKRHFIMKRFFCILLATLSVIGLCACGQHPTKDKETTTTEQGTEATTEAIYADSKYLGKWYNADTVEEMLVCELNADGTAVYQGTYKGTWVENNDDITITISKDEEELIMNAYFVISGDGFVARATEANMHYLDEGGELQLEIMLTENTCVDCIKK